MMFTRANLVGKYFNILNIVNLGRKFRGLMEIEVLIDLDKSFGESKKVIMDVTWKLVILGSLMTGFCSKF